MARVLRIDLPPGWGPTQAARTKLLPLLARLGYVAEERCVPGEGHVALTYLLITAPKRRSPGHPEG